MRRPLLLLLLSLPLLEGCANPRIQYPAPLPGPTTPDVVDIHTHFFNFCDLPEKAVSETFHVGDRALLASASKKVAAKFLREANEAACHDVKSGTTGSRRLSRKRAPLGLSGEIDMLRAASSDRAALANRYFGMYPEVALVTPSMVDADGWINPGPLPPTQTWQQRHTRQRELAKHLNDTLNLVRVLPIAGFNPMRAVKIDRRNLEFSDTKSCEKYWRDIAQKDYLTEFETLFEPTAEGEPPFIGVKICNYARGKLAAAIGSICV